MRYPRPAFFEIESPMDTLPLAHGHASPVRGRRLRVFVAWASWTAAVILLGITYLDLAASQSSSGGPLALDPVSAALVGVVVVAWSTAGAVLVTRLPFSLIGWLLCTVGLLFAVTTGSAALADIGIIGQPGSVPGAIWFGWLAQWSVIPAVALSAIVLPLVYPTGKLLSPRWRSVVALAVLAAILGFVGASFSPWPSGTLGGARNPLEADGPVQAQIGQILVTSNAVAGLAILLGVLSLVGRFRRARDIERLQLKWFAYVFVVSGSLMGLAFLASLSSGVTGVAQDAILLGFALLPATIGLAVLRYRLYDIDIVIRRTLVYVPLTAILAGTYAASIVLFQRLFITFTGNRSDGAVILSTLILATTFTPIKNSIQGRVDRSFRDAGDAERRLRAFTDEVAHGWARPDPARTLQAFLAVAVEATGASGGVVSLQAGAGERSAGEESSGTPWPVVVVPVAFGSRPIGRLELGPRRGGRPYSPADIATLEAAGERLAVVLGAVDAAGKRLG